MMLAVSPTLSNTFAHVDPPSVEEEIEQGTSITIDKTVEVPDIPPKVDVLLVMDLSGSMGGELSEVKNQMTDIIGNLTEIPDVDLQMGLISHEDYGQGSSPTETYDSRPTCNYISTYGLTSQGDEAFRIDQPMTETFTDVETAVNTMTLKYGYDFPESYARVVWELGQSDSGIGFRDDAFKVAVMFLDAVPHDCDLTNDGEITVSPSVTGIDPGRDAIIGTADDIDWDSDAIPAAQSGNVKLIVFDSSSNFEPSAFTDFWETWAIATGGAYHQIRTNGVPFAGDSELPELIEEQIEDAAAGPVTITAEPVGCDPLLVEFEPSSIDDVSPGSTVEFEETITVPEDADPGEVHCTVQFKSDGALIGEQDILITIPESNNPPVCDATPSETILWPPNHKMNEITLSGGSDPDGDPITLSVLQINQDEPVNDLGDGNTSPDGEIVDDSTVKVRAERSGLGDGRVYVIDYEISDGTDSCIGSVSVGVPHDKKDTPMDSGAIYDSSQS